MEKSFKRKVDRYIKRHTVDDVIKRFLGTRDVETEIYVANRIWILNNGSEISYIIFKILKKMSKQAMNEFLCSNLSFAKANIYYILTDKEISNKLYESTVNESLFGDLSVEDFLSCAEELVNAYAENKIFLPCLTMNFKGYLKEFVVNNINHLEDALTFFENREKLMKINLYPGDVLFEEKIINSKNFNYIFKYVYVMDSNEQKHMYIKIMENDELPMNLRLKFRYYYSVLIDNSKLSQMNNIEDIFLGAALYDNYNPINDDYTLINDIYNKFGTEKLKEYKDKNDMLFTNELSESLFKRK